MIRRPTIPGGGRRHGFTLLEVMLASAIAVLLMGGLYVAMEVQIRLTHEAREVVDQATLSRSLIQRLTTDLTPSLSPVLGRSQFSGSGAGATAASGSAGGATGSGTTGSGTAGSGTTGSGTTGSSATGASSGSSGSTGSSGTTQTTDTSSPAVPFQAGVVGSSQQLTIYVTRLPGQVGNNPAANAGGDGTVTPSDLRRISYWIAGTGGLARQETPWLTDAQLMNSTDPDFSNEAQSVIADEVTDVLFEYWDGSSWQSSWDGTQLSDDQKTPIGPPMAIAVTLTVKVGAKGTEKRYRHVIAIPTAPSPASSTTNSSTTGSGTMNSQ